MHLEPVCTIVGNTIYIKDGNGVAVGTYNPTDGKKQAWMAFMGNAELAQKMADLINEYIPIRETAETALINDELCSRCKNAPAYPIGGTADDSLCQMCRIHPS